MSPKEGVLSAYENTAIAGQSMEEMPRRTKTIMIVDDESGIRGVLAWIIHE